jgi:uncharacterized damage-inducible protein DinB
MDFAAMYGQNMRLIEPTIESVKTVDWGRAMTDNVCGWGSLRNLIAHTFEAEDYWFTKILKSQPWERYAYNDFADLESLRSKWIVVTANSLEYIDRLSENDFKSSVRRVKFEKEYILEVQKIILHVYTHTAHHRGQIVMAVRQMGGMPKDVDII